MFANKKESKQEHNWRDEASFPTQLAYIEYIRAQPFATQLMMAKANLPAAQRLVALHYCDQNDMKQHLFWLKESAKNNDPMSLLTLANFSIQSNNIDEAIVLTDKVVELKKNLSDQDYIESINEILSDMFFNIGLQCAESKELDKAKKAWEL